MAFQAQQVYQQQSVNTATPQELTLMLYNAGIKFLKQAKLAYEKKEMDEVNRCLIRVQDILTELELGLDRRIEIAQQMGQLYDFMKRHLVQANVKKDMKMVDDVLELFTEFRDTWKQAMELAKKQSAAPKSS
ncbi:flagellar export chaperone FliS [Bacillaceae bacterium]